MLRLVLLLFLCSLSVLGSGCERISRSAPKAGHSAQSPSGRFTYKLEIIQHPTNPKAKAWSLSISDFEGYVVYEDDTNMSSYYALNLQWDNEDRLWGYYTSDESVFFWAFFPEGQGWSKRKWGTGRNTFAFAGMTPPEAIYQTK